MTKSKGSHEGDAYKRGRKARQRRADLGDNPYRADSRSAKRHEGWRRGWEDEDREIAESGECEVG
ncbi:MAG: hypothetical protein GY769_08140 [bacterium]|nr:hypothetical protein [bacterium]